LAWQVALLAPKRVNGMVGMSVSYAGRGAAPPTEGWRKQYGENFFYIPYFQQLGVAKTEFDADPRGILERLYAGSIAAAGGMAEEPIIDPRMSAGGWIGRMPEPQSLPNWLSEEELDYVTCRSSLAQASAAGSTTTATSFGTGRRRRNSQAQRWSSRRCSSRVRTTW
jgi:hypothetical protein